MVLQTALKIPSNQSPQQSKEISGGNKIIFFKVSSFVVIKENLSLQKTDKYIKGRERLTSRLIGFDQS